MPLPTKYNWLSRVGILPRVITEALKEYGTIETPGRANNTKIMGWANETGLRNVYTADSVPWCGLFTAVIAKRASYGAPTNPLWALNWAKFGTEAGQPSLGDVLVFTRNGGGHVGFYIAEDRTTYHVLGGNQSDRVNITRIDKARLYASRRPKFRIGKPASQRPYVVNTGGEISVDEH
jgi:uncharacterized protein (TIGR02594 family)